MSLVFSAGEWKHHCCTMIDRMFEHLAVLPNKFPAAEEQQNKVWAAPHSFVRYRLRAVAMSETHNMTVHGYANTSMRGQQANSSRLAERT